MNRQPETRLKFHTEPSGCLFFSRNGKRRLSLFFLCAAVLSLTALLLIPNLRESAKAMCNKLFEISEATNNYVYEYFPVVDGVTPAPALILTGICVICLYLTAVISSSRILALVMAAALCGAQAYFGVPLPLWANIPAFALLGAVFIRNPSDLLPYGAGVLILALIISLLAPGVHIPTENASEAVRDRLSVMGQQIEENVNHILPETQMTQHKNRLNKDKISEDSDIAQSVRDYRHEQEQEQEISLPKRINRLKIIGILLLIIILLTVPFAFPASGFPPKKALGGGRNSIRRTTPKPSAPSSCTLLLIWKAAERDSETRLLSHGQKNCRCRKITVRCMNVPPCSGRRLLMAPVLCLPSSGRKCSCIFLKPSASFMT